MIKFCKISFYSLTIGLMGFLFINPSQAQTPAPDAVPPSLEGADSAVQGQTLFQEDAQKQEDKPAPSLSEYLNSAGAPSVPTSENAAAPENSLQMPPMPPSGAPAEVEESPEAVRSREEAEFRKEAFNASVNSMMPLKPSEIRRMLELYDETKQAGATPVYPRGNRVRRPSLHVFPDL